MARQIIDTGTLALNGQDGDTNRDAADKCNANFAELYNQNENFVRGAGVVQGGAMVVFAGTTGNQVAAATGGAPGTAAFKNTTDFASAAQGDKADNAQPKLSPGDNITIDNTDPLNPIISASGGGAGTVQTVAGVDPVGGNIPAAALATALGVDNKLDADDAAASAVKLQTARTINGESFDGTADITVTDDTKEPAIAAGSTAQYLNGAKAWADFSASVLSAVLQGLDLGTATAVMATDSVLSGIGKLQAQISARARSGVNNDITRLTAIDATGYGILRDGLPVFTGATSGVAGVRGLVPAPVALGSNPKFLSDDGTWKEAAAGGGGMAVGTMFPWKYSRATIPGGSLPHDGQIVTNGRTLYPDLWALIQAFCVTDAVWLAAPYTSRGMFSLGDGSTNFRMPDDNAKYSDGLTISAMTLRGDGKNSAGTPGLHQADQLQSFKMRTAEAAGVPTGVAGFTADATTTPGLRTGASTATLYSTHTSTPITDGVNGTPRVGSETRPANSTVIWCTVAAKTAVNTGSVDVTVLSNTVTAQGVSLTQQGSAITDLQGKQVITKKWTSADLAWANGGTLNLTHTLGIAWSFAVIKLKYKQAINGMAVGELSQISSILTTVAGSGNFGVEIRRPTTTNATLQIASNGIFSASAAGAATTVTPAQVDIVVELYA